MTKATNSKSFILPWRFTLPTRLTIAAALAVLSGCGGGGSDSRLDDLNRDSDWKQGVFKPASGFKDRCETPRTGIDPLSGLRYPDKSGDTLDENNWLRSWTNHTYLWYREVVDRDPGLYSTAAYFDLLKTSAVTPSGAPKDQFHFTYDTAEWNSLSGSGVSAGYGIQWAIIQSTAPDRDIRVAYTEPGTPATAQGVEIARGARVLEINGVDVRDDGSPAGVETINRALFPSQIGVGAEFVILDAGSDTPRQVTLTSASITSTPVQQVTSLQSETGAQVGYILFNDHIATSEQLLVDAVDELASAGVSELVLDLRYNGGGFLYIASQLAYMISGAGATEDKDFYSLSFNDKHPSVDPVTGEGLAPVPFYNTTRDGEFLPSLNLDRVYMLVGGNTCSASEAIINGLRGIGVEVILIGETTCGKPYGFYPTDNCATTYFTVQFKGNNHQGFGEYSDGFVPASSGLSDTRLPGCAVADDYDHALGDPLEARFAAALYYLETGQCPSSSAVSGVRQKPGFEQGEPEKDGLIYKNEGLRNSLLEIPVGSQGR